MAIYLDSNATTQVHPRVVEAMTPFFTDHWHNPSSGYGQAQDVKAAIENARAQVASLLGAKPYEIVFTGCGTESNNMAIQSLARQAGPKDLKILVSEIEHSAVLRPAEALAANGYEVKSIGVDSQCRLDLEAVADAVDSNRPGFVSFMWANNETGVIQPIAEAAEIAKQAGWQVHSDAIQAAGKTPLSVTETPVDFLSISGHKFHAPKGVGALYIRGGTEFEPMIRGGGQENGRRSGTENVPYIVGLGAAAAVMEEELKSGAMERVGALRDKLESTLIERIPGTQRNGHCELRTTNVAHLSFEGRAASKMLPRLDALGLQCSAGSACMTGKSNPSHVQKAMGFSDERALSSLRLSLSIFTTKEEIEEAVEILCQVAAEK